MADIVQILREMQQEEDCQMLVHRSARETPAFMPGRDSAAREACPFLSHPPFGWLSLHRSSIMCEWKSSERTNSGSIRRLSKK